MVVRVWVKQEQDLRMGYAIYLRDALICSPQPAATTTSSPMRGTTSSLSPRQAVAYLSP